MNDRISVIIPTYNRADWILRALESVIKAVEYGDEIIVIDDGSNDDTEIVLEKYKHVIQYIKTDNGGAGRARNIGVKIAANPLISFLDSDDEWTADHLLIHRQFLTNSNVLFSFSNFDLVDDTVSIEIAER
jgi:glycosyltransferase involved in cell wall biosynthesis